MFYVNCNVPLLLIKSLNPNYINCPKKLDTSLGTQHNNNNKGHTI